MVVLILPNTTHLAGKLVCHPLNTQTFVEVQGKYCVLSKVSMFKIQTHSFHIRGHDEVE